MGILYLPTLKEWVARILHIIFCYPPKEQSNEKFGFCMDLDHHHFNPRFRCFLGEEMI